MHVKSCEMLARSARDINKPICIYAESYDNVKYYLIFSLFFCEIYEKRRLKVSYKEALVGLKILIQLL